MDDTSVAALNTPGDVYAPKTRMDANILVAVTTCVTLMPDMSAPAKKMTALNMFVAVVHFIDGHIGTNASPNDTNAVTPNTVVHVIACAKDKLGMLLSVVAVTASANALATVVATGNDIPVIFHVGHVPEWHRDAEYINDTSVAKLNTPADVWAPSIRMLLNIPPAFTTCATLMPLMSAPCKNMTL